MKLLVLTLLLMVSYCYADTSDDLLHETAHFGATYIITHVTEVVCTKVIGDKHKIACTITGIVLSNTINIGRKVVQGLPNDSKRAIVSGAAGSVTAAIVINF